MRASASELGHEACACGWSCDPDDASTLSCPTTTTHVRCAPRPWQRCASRTAAANRAADADIAGRRPICRQRESIGRRRPGLRREKTDSRARTKRQRLPAPPMTLAPRSRSEPENCEPQEHCVAGKRRLPQEPPLGEEAAQHTGGPREASLGHRSTSGTARIRARHPSCPSTASDARAHPSSAARAPPWRF